jgi:hypothetical protein
MPGYSSIIYSVRKGEFNIPDGEGNTPGGEKFLSCFTNNLMSFNDLLSISDLSDDMIDVMTSIANPISVKSLNLFKPLNEPQEDEEEEAKLEQKSLVLKNPGKADLIELSIFERLQC